jgi:hypothetical protein
MPDWFEEVWACREETVYPRLFGPMGRGIFPLSATIFVDVFKQEFDPRWLHYGVFEFPPTQARASWLYVTSGMSNAWEDEEPRPDGPSGFGCEFVFETMAQQNWAIVRLQHLMAFQILLVHGRYPGREPLSPYDRIPLRVSISPEPSELRWLILAPPESYEARFQLASGWVDLYAVFGATEDEAALAREQGGDRLVEILKRHAAFPVTDPSRRSVVGAGKG